MDANEITKKLAAPFPAADVEWRAGAKNGDETKALALAYITSRAVMNRLDDVMGCGGWRDEYDKGPDGGVLCGLSLKIDGEWITKWDGAENSDFEAVKGGLSDAFKRAAVKWGIGRYLYNLDGVWTPCEKRGKTVVLKETPKLPAWALPANTPHQPAPKQTQPAQNDQLRVDKQPESVGYVNNSNITTPEPTPTNGNGHKAARPFTPEALKDAITKKAGKHSGATVSEGAKGLMVGQLNALFSGDENKRHQFTKYLTGYGSTKQMPGNVCQSILDWIGSDDEMAKREANAVIAFLDGQNGQMTLA